VHDPRYLGTVGVRVRVTASKRDDWTLTPIEASDGDP
jgi:hypothetical protein